jgi:hypothetical protein
LSISVATRSPAADPEVGQGPCASSRPFDEVAEGEDRDGPGRIDHGHCDRVDGMVVAQERRDIRGRVAEAFAELADAGIDRRDGRSGCRGGRGGGRRQDELPVRSLVRG